METGKSSRNDVEMRTEFVAHLDEHPAKHMYTLMDQTGKYKGFAVVPKQYIKCKASKWSIHFHSRNVPYV